MLEGDERLERNLSWTFPRQAERREDEAQPSALHDSLPARLYGIMAVTTLATWGTLAGSYQLLF